MTSKRPPKLTPGARIAIVAPSSPCDEAEVRAGMALLESRGYKPVLAPHALDRLGGCGESYLAGSDEDRALDLQYFLGDPTVSAVLCARGGYGCSRLLERINWNEVVDSCKIFIGYSDVTTLHMAIARHAGLVTFHGPMISALPKLSEEALAQYWRMLEVAEPHTLCDALPGVETLVGGSVEGELAGGCLSLIAHGIGSRHIQDFEGKILLLEDIGEAVYRADRYLHQLLHAGILESAAGFVIGNITRWESYEADPPANSPRTLFKSILEPLGKPAVIGYPFGHEPNPQILPLGVNVHLDADKRLLRMLEPAVK